MREAAAFKTGITIVNLAHQTGKERHVFQHLERQVAGPQAIIDIMGVVGDIVGDGRDLRLQARITRQFQIVKRTVVQDRLRHRSARTLAVGRE